ncbi:MAG TPA: universal stress protein [Streptosporangiaceae bacterium]|jgi:nucleotide-binding universal stress UspA family protein|nr:universal stress protein [Streptosporangiaceae bacterium]
MPGIVVGVDGSSTTQLALEWAMKEAAIKQAPLTVLAVHQVAISYWTGDPLIFPADEEEVQKVRKATEEAVQRATGQIGDVKPPSVTVRALSGLPARELINASHDAEQVVVGARGGGGFAALRIGSVTSQVVQHAECPVTVIHGKR